MKQHRWNSTYHASKHSLPIHLVSTLTIYYQSNTYLMTLLISFHILSMPVAILLLSIAIHPTLAQYDLLHVGPPHRTAQVLGTVPDLLDRTGYVNVDKFTCRHVHFDNVFALGDCSNIPTSKTAAAIS